MVSMAEARYAYLALGLGSAATFFGFVPDFIYCFSKSGEGAIVGLLVKRRIVLCGFGLKTPADLVLPAR